MIGAGRRRGGFLPAALAAMLLLPAPTRSATAQAAAAGRVLRPGPSDTAQVAGVRVVLHQVGTERQGPIDSVLSGAGGRFRFRFRPDSGTVYLLSARYAGIEYFSLPIPAQTGTAEADIPLLVHDTSSTAPVSIAARHLIVPRPGEGGAREALDLVVLRNEGYLARVAPDTQSPSFTLPLPPGSEGLEVGDSDVSQDAVSRRGDFLDLSAPIGPGEKQLSLQYHLPGGLGTVVVPVGPAGGVVNVLLEEPGATATGPGLAAADSQIVLGRAFHRWSGEVPPGESIRIRLPGPPRDPAGVLAVLVGVVALALGLAWWRAGRRSSPPTGGTAPADRRNELLDRLARLDQRYAGREAEVPADEWSAFLAERARLKRELEDALAGGHGPG